MSRRIGQVLLAVALAIFAFWMRGRGGPASPEAAVQAWFDAAGRGDDRACLSLVSGPLRASLESTRTQQGAAAFRQGLRSSVAGLRGVAVARAGEGADGRVELDVDLVFDAKNERQRAVLVSDGRSWTITAFGSAGDVIPPVRYGTPAFE